MRPRRSGSKPQAPVPAHPKLRCTHGVLSKASFRSRTKKKGMHRLSMNSSSDVMRKQAKRCFLSFSVSSLSIRGGFLTCMSVGGQGGRGRPTVDCAYGGLAGGLLFLGVWVLLVRVSEFVVFVVCVCVCCCLCVVVCCVCLLLHRLHNTNGNINQSANKPKRT